MNACEGGSGLVADGVIEKGSYHWGHDVIVPEEFPLQHAFESGWDENYIFSTVVLVGDRSSRMSEMG